MPFLPLERFDPGAFDVIVHATALGHQVDDPLPFDVEALRPETAVVDMVYDAEPTRLERRAAHRGCTVVSGREVLLHQALGQFQLMPGRELGRALGAELLGID